MARPIFGDKVTIESIDPWKKFMREGLDLPKSILACATCGGQLHIRFDDIWIDVFEFGAGTIDWYCLEDPKHRQHYDCQDEVMADEQNIVNYIKKLYPMFQNYC